MRSPARSKSSGKSSAFCPLLVRLASSTFRSVAAELAERCRKLAEGTLDVTLVFDKGNNTSAAALE